MKKSIFLFLLLNTSLAFCFDSVSVPPPSAEAVSFYRSGNILWALSRCFELIIPILILFTGFSAKIRNIARTLGRVWFFEVILYFIFYYLLLLILNLPYTYYLTYIRLKDYGLSFQTFHDWLINFVKSGWVNLGIGLLVIWIPYLLIKKSPKKWWVYTWLLSIPIMLLFQVIAPVWIDPIFNRYGPMKDKKLEQQILQLAECAGIEGSRVYEVDRSKDTKMMNAYVTGFGQTKRIVLTDTIIQGMSAKELLFVMGHEMGHYVLHHMWYGLAYFSCLALLGLYLIDKLAKSAIRKFSIKFRFTHLGDIASLPLLLVLFQAFMLLSTPLSNYVSRVMEHEADIFGLEITKDNRAAAEAFVKLQRENLAYPRPGPIYIFWRSTHPPLGQRVDFCNSYRPWVRGVPLKYAAKFNRCQSSRDPL